MLSKSCLMACLTGVLGILPLIAKAEMPDLLSDISAGTIVAISDGDFVAQTYATGRLTPAQAGYRDILTIISLTEGEIASRMLPVSNSVTAPPEVLDITSDGKTAFVIERLGQRPDGGQTVGDLPAGNRLYAIDLTKKAEPRIAEVTTVSEMPESLAVSPDGSRIAVLSNTPDASIIQFLTYEDGAFEETTHVNLIDLGIKELDEAPPSGIAATAVNWHPSGRFVAANINTQNIVVFLEVIEMGEDLKVQPWGNSVEVGVDPFIGRFTPDGRHFLTSDWRRNFDATTLEDRLPEAPSSISVVRVAGPNATGEAIRHERISGTNTDLSAEGIAISPDGRLVATINMRGTVFPPASPRFQRDASVTLLALDGKDGTIVKIADYPIEGILPEGGSFDLTGDHFMATVYQGHENATPESGAGLEVFRVIRGKKPALARMGRVPMSHGVHHVVVAP